MKKRWLSLAVAFLMVFALISQGVTPVLAEKGIAIGQAEEQLNIEAEKASNIEEELLIGGNEEGPVSGNELSVDQTGDGLTLELEDLGLDLDANGIVRDELPVEVLEGAVQANAGVQYVSRSWDGSQVVSETLECTGYSTIDDDTEDLSGWYVVDSRLDLDDRLNVSGTANIILVDGARLYDEDGIRVSPGSTLNIYGQSGDSGELYLDADTNDNAALGGDEGEGCGTINIYGGQITADTKNLGEDAAGIGGGEDGSGGMITIYGGHIRALGGSGSYNGGAGIGGGGAGSGVSFTMYGGYVNAMGGANAAGIGGGDEGGSGIIAIYGGTINAWGGSDTADGGAGIGGGNERGADSITIHGGNITAVGGCDGAGIGGGDNGSGGNITVNEGTIHATGGDNGAGIGGGDNGNGGIITINDGEITANGGCDGAGIGGGEGRDGSNITINDGKVNATGGEDGAGIGGGDGGTSGTIVINDGDITAQGGLDGAGIGGGNDAVCSSITIKGGTVRATGGDYAAGIGGGDRDVDTTGGTITISGGKVTAKGGMDGAGIGGGEDNTGGTITISGGTVNATGGSNTSATNMSAGAGIGGGDDADGGTITISGGTVNAHSGKDGAGIGGGDHGNSGIITISGGVVTAYGYESKTTDPGQGAGIGGGEGGKGEKITISGGKVTATGYSGGAGIGGGCMNNDNKGGDGGIISISGGEVIAEVVEGTIDHRPISGAGIGNGYQGESATITLTHSGANSVSVQTPHFIASKDKNTTVTMLQSFKDLNADIIYAAKSYTGTDLNDMQDLNLVPADGSYTSDKKPSRITLKPKTAVYTGRTIHIGKARVTGSTGKVTYAYYSDAKCTKKVSEHKNAGVYYVKASVAADDSYQAATSKAVKLTIKKAPNPMTVFPKELTIRKSALTKTIYCDIAVANAKGKVTCKAYSKARKAGIRVTNEGLVTVPKNCSKGTYKIRVLAGGTKNYKAKSYCLTVTVK